jgi:glutamyl-tRNA synthetase
MQISDITRLAPSPTGALHLGNARTFLVNAALAHRLGWRTLLRIEDLDTPRVKPETILSTRETLAWLGLSWDTEAPLQSLDLEPFRDAMRSLATMGLVYPCERTRGDIEQAQSAPNEGDHETRFPPELRPAGFTPGVPVSFDREDLNWRFAVGSGGADPVARFSDRVAGEQTHDVGAAVGDFLVWTKRVQPSYQLAVVVDDARQGITQIVRGDDLLPSAARQLLLWRALAPSRGWGVFPEQWHLPLVRGPDGRRLAKRHGDTRIEHYRSRGVPAERIVGLIASWCGVTASPEPMPTAAFFERFDPGRMPRDDITFTEADHRWLIMD